MLSICILRETNLVPNVVGKEVEIEQKTIFSLKRLEKVVSISWIWLIAKKDEDPMGSKYEDLDVHKTFLFILHHATYPFCFYKP